MAGSMWSLSVEVAMRATDSHACGVQCKCWSVARGKISVPYKYLRGLSVSLFNVIKIEVSHYKDRAIY